MTVIVKTYDDGSYKQVIIQSFDKDYQVAAAEFTEMMKDYLGRGYFGMEPYQSTTIEREGQPSLAYLSATLIGPQADVA